LSKNRSVVGSISTGAPRGSRKHGESVETDSPSSRTNQQECQDFGINTVSMTWITPFD
jgi:hypothetical protein